MPLHGQFWRSPMSTYRAHMPDRHVDECHMPLHVVIWIECYATFETSTYRLRLSVRPNVFLHDGHSCIFSFVCVLLCRSNLDILWNDFWHVAHWYFTSVQSFLTSWYRSEWNFCYTSVRVRSIVMPPFIWINGCSLPPCSLENCISSVNK